MLRREFLIFSAAGLALPSCLPSPARAGLIEAPPGPDVLRCMPQVALVGIGTVGTRLMTRMDMRCQPDVDRISIDADTLVREAGAAGMRLALGLGQKRGHCVGRREIDTSAAVAHRASIARALGNADLVLLTGSLGGHLVTATAPFVAHLARDAGALTLAVVTTPFGFEGRGRIRQAEEGLRDLGAVCDSTLVVSGDRSIDICGSNAPLRDALECRDDAVCCAIRAITGAVTLPGRTYVGLADIHAAFCRRGAGVVGLGVGTGAERAEQAAANALSCPLLREFDVAGAGGVFVEVAAGELGADEIERAAHIIWRTVGDQAALIIGSAHEPHLGERLRVTLVAAGPAGRQDS